MLEKLEILEQKINALIEALETAKSENERLKSDHKAAINELSTLKKEHEQLRLSENDKNEKMKTSLTRILSRLDELEQIAS